MMQTKSFAYKKGFSFRLSIDYCQIFTGVSASADTPKFMPFRILTIHIESSIIIVLSGTGVPICLMRG